MFRLTVCSWHNVFFLLAFMILPKKNLTFSKSRLFSWSISHSLANDIKDAHFNTWILGETSQWNIFRFTSCLAIERKKQWDRGAHVCVFVCFND